MILIEEGGQDYFDTIGCFYFGRGVLVASGNRGRNKIPISPRPCGGGSKLAVYVGSSYFDQGRGVIWDSGQYRPYMWGWSYWLIKHYKIRTRYKFITYNIIGGGVIWGCIPVYMGYGCGRNYILAHTGCLYRSIVALIAISLSMVILCLESILFILEIILNRGQAADHFSFELDQRSLVKIHIYGLAPPKAAAVLKSSTPKIPNKFSQPAASWSPMPIDHHGRQPWSPMPIGYGRQLVTDAHWPRPPALVTDAHRPRPPAGHQCPSTTAANAYWRPAGHRCPSTTAPKGYK